MYDYYSTMMFLRLEEPQNTEYDGIVAVLNNAFNYFGMGNWKEKLIVFFFRWSNCHDGGVEWCCYKAICVKHTA